MRKLLLSGFTLIELLIIVAFLGILAAIASPNFLQAQARTRVTVAKSEMHKIAEGLEAYLADNSAYPLDGGGCSNAVVGWFWFVPNMLTTPINYVSAVDLIDPFRQDYYKPGDILYPDRTMLTRYRYQNINDTWGMQAADLCGRSAPSIYWDEMMCIAGDWCLHSSGPDSTYTNGTAFYTDKCNYPAHPDPYDPTNGTFSWGNIMRFATDPL